MKTMTMTRVFALTIFAAMLAVATTGLASCSAAPGADDNAVAVTINDTEIKESTVTGYIEKFRTAQQVTEDDAWGLWLTQYSMTPSQVRDDVIQYYVNQELVKQAAAEKDVKVTDEEIQEQVDNMKANYGNDDAAWTQALEQAGMTEEEYRENVQAGILEEKLRTKVIEENSSELTDEELLEQAKQYAPYFDGARKSSHILFAANEEATAKEVLAKINAGELDFAEAAKQYSQDTGSAEKGGDVGWDMLNSFVTAYTDALSALEEGQTSDLVTSDFGIHVIRCTQKFTAAEEITSLDQLPSELVDYIREMANSSAKNEAYNTWYEEYKNNAKIEIADMPKGLSYDIDASLYQTATSSSAATDDLGLDGDLTSSEMEEIAEAQAEAAAMDAEGTSSEAVAEDEQTGSEKVAA